MSTQITFQPDVVSLAIAGELMSEQGVTLEEIAAEAFSAYMEGVRAARAIDLDEQAQDS